MATARQIRDLITQTTSGTVRLRVPREVRDEVCRYAVRRRKAGAAWALIARETGLDVRNLQRWNTRARRAASVPVLRMCWSCISLWALKPGPDSPDLMNSDITSGLLFSGGG